MKDFGIPRGQWVAQAPLVGRRAHTATYSRTLTAPDPTGAEVDVVHLLEGPAHGFLVGQVDQLWYSESTERMVVS